MALRKAKPKTWDDYKDRYDPPLSVRLPAGVRAELRRVADEQGLSTAQVVATLTDAWCRRYRRKKRNGTLRKSKSATRRIIYSSVKPLRAELAFGGDGWMLDAEAA